MNKNEDDSGFEEDSDKDIFVHSRNSSVNLNKLNDSIKEESPPPIPLVHSGINLAPDMLFGWRPKSLLTGGPISFSFVSEFIPSKTCIFNGYRPEDSFELHEAYSGTLSYPFLINQTINQAYKILKSKQGKADCRPFTGMKEEIDENLKFDSKFESGNLDKVCKVKDDEYDLYLRNDTNAYRKNQWYYFKITNIAHEKEVKMNILNFCKNDSLYNQGLQPCIYRESYPQKGWHYMCENIKYCYSKLNKSLIGKKSFYCLSFSLKFPAYETLKFAYSVPYTYSDLLMYLNTIQDSLYLKRESLCKSLSGVDIPLLTVSDFSCQDKKDKAIVTARVHPGETHGSWIMQGFIDFLIGDSFEAYRLRKFCIFKIVPMLNPDGVIVGNSRCSLNGQDLNRQFQNPDNLLHPEIYQLKSMIFSSKEVLVYLDFHAHSKKKGIFIYGPYFPLHSDYHCKIRVIPRLLSENTEIFRYYSCKFRNDWSKRKAARLVISKEYFIPFSYTVEASSFGYLNNNRDTDLLTVEKLQTFGKSVLCSVLQYIDLRNEEVWMKEARAELRKGLKLSPAKKNKRTLDELLEIIKNDLNNEIDSDSGGSDSDSSNEEEEMKVNKKILSMLKTVTKLAQNPERVKRCIQSQPPKAAKIPKKKDFGSFRAGQMPKKTEESEHQVKSTLAKYFSRAYTENKSKFKYRPESVKRPTEPYKRPKLSKPKEIISKFSYFRGLYALKPRSDNL